jgi:hypothetical protein
MTNGTWQPIETAPKDGTYIWVSQGFSMRVAFWASGKSSSIADRSAAAGEIFA